MPRIPIRSVIETWKASQQNYSATAHLFGTDRRTVKHWVDQVRQPWGYLRWQGVQHTRGHFKSYVRVTKIFRQAQAIRTAILVETGGS
jgi:hypothetical protein